MSDWVEQLDQAMTFVEDADHRTHILFRFESQYLPALQNARNQEQVWRAWEAFHHYLIARPTNRKPFSLSGDEADRLILMTIELLGLPPHSPP